MSSLRRAYCYALRILGALLLVAISEGCILPRPFEPIVANPFGGPGFRVLVVIEQTSAEIPLEQELMLASTKPNSVRSYCERKCVQLPDGTPAFRVFDPQQTADLSRVDYSWRRAVEYAAKKQLTPPYMVATDGKRQAYFGPLPADNAATMKILLPIGGE